MDENTAKFLAQASVFAAWIPAMIGLLKWKQFSWHQHMLLKLVFVAVLTELMAYMLVKLFQLNNLFLVHVFTVIEFILLALIYKKELLNIITPKKINTLIALFVIYAIINSIFIESITQFNGFARAVSSILIIIFTLFYFYKTLKELKIQRLEKEPMFWLSIGLLIYFSASLFIFIFGNYIQPSVKLSFTFWGIHAILNISLYLFYAIALWIKPQKTV